MTANESVFQVELFNAVLAFILISIFIELLLAKLLNAVSDVEFTHWIVGNILAPLARAASIILFIILAFPALFKINQLPPLNQLLVEGELSIGFLVNLAFLLPFIIAVIPVVNRFPAMILPLQGMVAGSFIYYLILNHFDYSLPDLSLVVWSLLQILFLGMVFHFIARYLADTLSPWVNETFTLNDSESLIYHISLLIGQIPLIVLFSISLTSTLPTA